jgi:hypothetical protein
MSAHINSTLAYLRLVDAPQSIIDNVAALATERDALLAALRMVCDSGVALADPIERAMLDAIAKATAT